MKSLSFLMFQTICPIIIVGKLGQVALIYREHHPHTPMHPMFQSNFTLMDSCCSCAITPKTIENFFSKDRIISLFECMAQWYFLCRSETADCFLLAAMVYDLYVAICNPLQSHTRISKKLSIQMTTGAYRPGNLLSLHNSFWFSV